MGAALSFYFPKACECSVYATCGWLVYVLCGVLCCLGLCAGAVAAIAYIPVPDVTDQPPVLRDYARVDLASLRHLLLEGFLWFPPPPPAPPPLAPPLGSCSGC